MLQAFSAWVTAMQPLFAIGEAGVKLATAMLQSVLGPYTNGDRNLQAALDEMVEQAPEIAAKMAAQQDQSGQKAGQDANQQGLVEAQQELAKAENIKAQAAMAKVQADASLNQSKLQQQMAELQSKLQIEGDKHNREVQAIQAKADADTGKLHVQVAGMAQQQDKQQADIDLIRSQIAVNLASIHLDVRKQDLDEYTAASAEQAAAEAVNAPQSPDAGNPPSNQQTP
jgi:hypothetical protein